jgi:hypothetical protein
LKITLSTGGGLYAATKRIEIDTNTLPVEEQTKLQNLIDQSNFFTLSNLPPPPGAADYNSYMLKIEDKNKSHSVKTTTFSMTNELNTLIGFILSLSKKT